MKFSINYRSLPVSVKASFWFLICTVLQRSVTIITTPIFTRFLTTEEYGSYGAFISWMGILSCFVTLSLSSGVYMQTIIKYDKKREQYSSAMQGLTMTLILLCFLIYLIFSAQLNALLKLTISQMTAMFLIMWSNAIFGFWSSEQKVLLHYKKLIAFTLIECVMQPILCVYFITSCPLFRDKVSGIVWGIACTTFVSWSPLLISHLKRGKLFFSKRIWLRSLKLSIPLIPHYLSGVVLNNSDRIMIRRIIGEHDAGLYHMAYTISMCGLMINQAVLQTLSPWMYKKIKSRDYHDINDTVCLILLLIAGVNLLVILMAPEIIRIFAPPSYYHAVWVMPPITMSVYFMFAYNIFAFFEFYYEKASYISTATSLGALLNLALNYIFIRKFGYLAAAYTTLTCYIVFDVVHYAFMKKINAEEMNGVPVFREKMLFGISAVFLLTGFLLMSTFRHTWIRYVLMTLPGILGFRERKRIAGLIAKLRQER